MSIGESVKVDLEKLKKLTTSISNYTGLALNRKEIKGDQLTHQRVMANLNSLSVKENDVVIFYYSGHGYNPGQTKWPAMNLGDKTLTLRSVFDLIKRKNPRFFLVIADTCNVAISNRFFLVAPRTLEARSTRPESYQQLFLESLGYIIASAAKPGQFAWSNSQTGGFFTRQWLGSLNQALTSYTPSWQRIMTRATRMITLPNEQKQNPQSKVEIEGETQVVHEDHFENGNLEGENDSQFQWLLDIPQSGQESDALIFQ